MLDSATKHLILNITSYTALTAGGLALLYWACFIARKPRRFCPGQRRPKAAWLWPVTWATFPQCGYDLPREDGPCRCPECGRESRPKQRRRSSTSIAYRRAGILLILAGLFPPTALWIRSERWAAHTPTTALLLMRSTLGEWTPHAARRQLRNRANPYVGGKEAEFRGIPLPHWQQRWLLGTFIDDLRDDGVAENAAVAQWAISWFPHEQTTPLLTACLTSDDFQQRQYAAETLRTQPGFKPTPDLARVCVEGLRNDYVEGRRVSWMSMSNAKRCFDYLLDHGELAEPFLKDALSADDAQQRFLAAVIAVATRREPILPIACPILVESLGDDRIADNAKFAAAALLRLGKPALAYLEPVSADANTQRRQIATLLVARINDPLAPPPPAIESNSATISQFLRDPSLLKLENMERHTWEFPAIRPSPLQ